MAKYTPKTKDELKRLVVDESIYLGDIDTSAITDMGSLFKGSKRQDFRGIEKWNTSNVVNMLAMFFDATTFNHNINSWNVSNVVDMAAMFFGATTFNQPLNKWDTSSVVNMYRMFTVATRFNQPLDNWDTSNVEFMTEMFSGALSFNQNLDSWNVDNVKNNKDMFENSGMINLPKWWCEKVIEFKWYRDKQGRRVVISEFTIEYMNVSKAMRKHIKKDSQSGKYIPKTRNELWTLCYYLEDDDIALGDIDTSNITDMRGIFNSSLFLERVDYSGIETWDTSKVVDKTELFKGAKSFNYNINSWNVSNVVSMCLMFANAEKFNQPLNNWDTSSVEFMTKMFNYAESFNQNLNSWDVSSVRDNAEMFLGSGMDKLPK